MGGVRDEAHAGIPWERRSRFFSRRAAPKYGSALLVVDDILISTVVMPFLRGWGQHALDDVYGWLDDQGVRLGGRVRRRLKKKVGLSDQDPAKLVSRLGKYVEKHPGTPAKLTVAVLGTADARDTDDELLEVVVTFLVAVFRLVKELGRPAVLPGFLTGPQGLAVIDVRTRARDEDFQAPTVNSYRDPPRITLVQREVPPVGGQPLVPRTWLVNDSAGTREEAERLAAGATVYIAGTGFDSFMLAMNDQLAVAAIERNRVFLRPAGPVPGNGLVASSLDEHEIPWAESPEAVTAMYQSLVGQVESKVAQEKEWREKWLRALLAVET